MTQPKFKSDARPSDTKSVVLHKETDTRLLAHLRTIKRESQWWRAAGNFYLDFNDWLATLPPVADAPEPNRPWIYYQTWLETRQPPNPPAFQPSNLPTLQPSDFTALLPAVRDVVEAALATALAGLSLPPSPSGRGAGGEGLELAELFSADLVLEVE